jgi:hypothetical protein
MKGEEFHTIIVIHMVSCSILTSIVSMIKQGLQEGPSGSDFGFHFKDP